jgi:ankyrin repeat protein
MIYGLKSKLSIHFRTRIPIAVCLGGARKNIQQIWNDDINVLLAKDADVNAQGGDYGNALQAACSEGHLEVAKVLLAKDADVNAQGGKYGNALQAACYGGHLEVVTKLLNKGADVNARGGEHSNALHAARASGNHGVIDLVMARVQSVSLEENDDIVEDGS